MNAEILAVRDGSTIIRCYDGSAPLGYKDLDMTLAATALKSYSALAEEREWREVIGGVHAREGK